MVKKSSSSLGFVQLEDVPCTLQVDGVSVHGHGVLAGVRRDVVHIFHGVSVIS